MKEKISVGGSVEAGGRADRSERSVRLTHSAPPSPPSLPAPLIPPPLEAEVIQTLKTTPKLSLLKSQSQVG